MPKPMRKETKADSIHAECGHPWAKHTQNGLTITCPPLPPAKAQVVLDEAVAEKGGKPGSDFVRQLEDATGATAAKEKEAEAARLYALEPVELPAEVLQLSVDELRASPRNPRTDLGDLTELAQAIEKEGVLAPITVRQVGDADTEGAYEIISGHRRVAAAKLAGLDSVPAIVLDGVSDARALELNLSEQINRRDLTPLEEGEACRQLQELSGYSVDQVAGKLGQSSSWVRGRLALVTLAPEVKRALVKGDVSLTVAKALSALPTQKLQAQALESLPGDADAAVRATDATLLSALRETFCRPLKGAPWKLTDETLVPEAGACSTCPKNSANNLTPGLFDAVKVPPTCTSLPCFDSKVAAAWAKATSKHRAAGAKVLSPVEGGKLFTLYDGKVRLNGGSRYVEAADVVQEDGAKRTWAQLVERVEAEHRPQLHVAQDKAGRIHELFVKDKATEAIAQHLELKWAKREVQRSTQVDDTPVRDEAHDVEVAARNARRLIVDQVVATTAKRIVEGGFTLPRLRNIDIDIEAYLEAMGDARKREEFEKKAALNEWLAALWYCSARFSTWDGFDEEFEALAKAERLDLKAMVRAQAKGELARKAS